MLGRLFGIVLVVLAATVGWLVLAATLGIRTDIADHDQREQLTAFGNTQQTQQAPAFALVAKDGSRDAGRSEVDLLPASSRINVSLALDQRRKGLLWYNTYAVDFSATYRVEPRAAGRLRLRFAFPSSTSTYDDFSLVVNGTAVSATSANGMLFASVPVARDPVTVRVAYRSHGLGTWTYRFGNGVVPVRDFILTMATNFRAIDFPPQTLTPTQEVQTPHGWVLTWQYRDLVGGLGIGMVLPQRLQPGPLAERLAAWAPLSLIFYVFVLLVITGLRGIELHPVNYFFLAAAFFAFHLLFAYTVDRMPVEYAFIICSAVSMTLTITYLRLVAGLSFCRG